MKSPRKTSVDETSNPKMRLQKFLAAAGLGSRRGCEELIESGRVTIDGKVASRLGVTVDPKNQKVSVDGQHVRLKPKRYYVINKPKGYLCTHSDPSGRKRVLDLFPAKEQDLFPIGRLDENSQGLLLVTNDGELANKLAHPRYHVSRTYRVQVAGIPTVEILEELKKGIHFHEGKFRVEGVRRLSKKGRSSFIELVLHEGQNREIRRLFARVGHKVMQLERTSFGPIRLGRLGLGKIRPLKPFEINQLRDYIENSSERVEKGKLRTPKKKSTESRTRPGKYETAKKRTTTKKKSAAEPRKKTPLKKQLRNTKSTRTKLSRKKTTRKKR